VAVCSTTPTKVRRGNYWVCWGRLEFDGGCCGLLGTAAGAGSLQAAAWDCQGCWGPSGPGHNCWRLRETAQAAEGYLRMLGAVVGCCGKP